MERRVEERGEFKITGIELRTANEIEAGPEGKIMGHWGKFMGETKEAIPAKVNDLVYGLYSDYENFDSGEYSLTIGMESSESAPADMVTKTIPSSKYMVFTTEPGPIPQIIIDGWQYIWKFFEENQNHVRAFTGDFELYDERVQDPQNAVMEFWIAVE